MSQRNRSSSRAVFASLAALILTTGTLVVTGCGDDGGASASSDGKLSVVTTVSPLTNITANVAGGLADVEGIVPEGENSHEFEPKPSVAKTLSQADLVIINGLHLEEPTKELAEANLADGAQIVELGDQTISPDEYIYDFSFPKEKGDPNPHLWTNPLYAKRYAEIVKDTLSDRDPDNADAYAKNYERYAKQVDDFDAALKEATATVPRERRKLLTYHDSFPYFARDYDWDVVGAIQPADFSDPTPKEVGELIEQVRDEQVPAIFGSEVFPSPVLDQIAKESGARYVDDLRDDDLPGEAGSSEHSLLSLLQFDYTTIIDALGGESAALERLDVTNPVSDDATYAG
jgi:ABC-type Zn uptake system ZnuABC Zn-binding protein ZnuA